MAETHSIAKRKQWASKTDEEKSSIMSKIAKMKQVKMSLDERRAHSLKMIQAKKNKQNG